MEKECDQFDELEEKYRQEVYGLKKENLKVKCQLGLITPAQAVASLGDASVKEEEFLSEFEKLALEKNPEIAHFEKPETPVSQRHFRSTVCEIKNEENSTETSAAAKKSPKKNLGSAKKSPKNIGPIGSSSSMDASSLSLHTSPSPKGLTKTAKNSEKSCITQ